MTLNKLAKELRDMADQVADLGRELALPQQEYSLAEAAQRLRAAYPEDYVTITFELRCHAHAEHNKPSIQWEAYSSAKGVGTHEAASLAGAVNKCLLAGVPKSTDIDALTTAQAKLDAPAPF